jgi:hypothetical protein
MVIDRQQTKLIIRYPMLGNIPRRLTAPFGLLGDEAKLAFSTQPGGVAKLATVRVSDVEALGPTTRLQFCR